MPNTPPSHLAPTSAELQRLRRGAAYGNACVVADIQCACVRVQLTDAPYGGHWYDTRPMLDANEHAPQALDMAAEALAYAVEAGLVVRHPETPHLVRLVGTAATTS